MKSFAQIRRKQGFTIVEVVMASIIFALTAAGIYTTLSALRQPAGESARDVTAAFLGEQFLQSMRNEVDQSTWNSGRLTLGNHTETPVIINGITYSIAYTVSADSLSDARKVVLNISW